MITATLLIIAAYLLGSVSSAIIVCRLMGLPDPRTQGSNNPGATNVLRIGGKKAAAITLVGDSFKGLIPMLVGHALGAGPAVLAGIGLAAFIGHLYPVFFGFKGGKGVATALGVQFGLYWPIGLCVAAVWLFVAKVLKISSLSGLISMALAPVFVWLFWDEKALIGMQLIITGLLIWRHRSNIRNLLDGTEDRISAKASSD
ncbi:glycerol-3-phosphate 1-O-acyltransferase PlsY [Allochromatium humboldtianum]|uniref:Glycerol-3-phosphate acyltransferase n=1 Tax=Allochromatium humboldtianum TaxID=504901 RepID=A0A850R6D2_9GAMM|nr:glycerol-3-phosphate 1-O-acyltransferase PlsY [Allochromatium humboldtianum]NVZ08355.1 glycerol-3-phosphate 1-O-acyltransferase PlsY [Allochromatium humboldtianum]